MDAIPSKPKRKLKLPVEKLSVHCACCGIIIEKIPQFAVRDFRDRQTQ